MKRLRTGFATFLAAIGIVALAAAPAAAQVIPTIICAGAGCDIDPNAPFFGVAVTNADGSITWYTDTLANGGTPYLYFRSPANFDTLDKGVLVAGPMSQTIITPPMNPPPPEQVHGTYTTRVWLDSRGVYTYEVVLTPIVDEISVVNALGAPTVAGLPGFNGVAGWSFSQAAAMTPASYAYQPDPPSGPYVALSAPNEVMHAIGLDDGTITWMTHQSGFWPLPSCFPVTCAGGTPLTFFYQSTWAPTANGVYSMTNQYPGTSAGLLAPTIAPVFQANAGPDQSLDEGVAGALDGTQSVGPNLHYSWKQIAPDPAAGVVLALSDPTSATPTFNAPFLPGGFGTQTFTLQLTVSNGGAPSTDTVDIIVKNVNHAPVALAETPSPSVKESTAVVLNSTSAGMKSYDPDGDAITYQWVQTGGPSTVTLQGATTEQATFTAPTVSSGSATYTFQLTVSDGALSSAATVAVTVEHLNHPPVANAGSAQTVNTGAVVTLDASKSSDPDGDVLSYQWTQTAGAPVQVTLGGTATPKFVAPSVAGTLGFSLVVNDPSGAASAPSSVTINVVRPNDPPRCDLAAASPALLWPPDHKMQPITITGVTDPNRDTFGIDILGVTQDEPVNGLGDGDTAPDAIIKKDAHGTTLLVRSERAGNGNGRVYKVNFRATDQWGASCTGSVAVSVPHAPKETVIDSGQRYDSTKP